MGRCGWIQNRGCAAARCLGSPRMVPERGPRVQIQDGRGRTITARRQPLLFYPFARGRVPAAPARYFLRLGDVAALAPFPGVPHHAPTRPPCFGPALTPDSATGSRPEPLALPRTQRDPARHPWGDHSALCAPALGPGLAHAATRRAQARRTPALPRPGECRPLGAAVQPGVPARRGPGDASSAAPTRHAAVAGAAAAPSAGRAAPSARGPGAGRMPNTAVAAAQRKRPCRLARP